MADLYPYQYTGAAFLAERRFAMLADDMGLGKSAQSIYGCDLVDAVKVLVICPAIARVNWQREFTQWQTNERRVGVAYSAALLPKVLAAHDVIVVSYNLVATSSKAREILTRPWDVVILDEAHSLKNPKARRSRAVYGHRFDRKNGVTQEAERVWALTGTPMPNHPAELWTHIRALWPEKLEVKGYQPFVMEFCITRNDGFSEKIIGGRNFDKLAAILKDNTLRRITDEVLTQLPPIRWDHVRVEPDKLPPAEFSDEELLVLGQAQQRLAEGKDIDDLSMHLATIRKWTGSAKASAVAELIAGTEEKIVVFYIHSCVGLTLMSSIANAAVINGNTPVPQRQALIDAFQGQEDGPRVLLCQLSIASTALTLTAAAHVVFAETSWTPSDMQQAAKRCHRIGQTRSVLVRVVSLAGSLDEDINGALIRKARLGRALDTALIEEQA